MAASAIARAEAPGGNPSRFGVADTVSVFSGERGPASPRADAAAEAVVSAASSAARGSAATNKHLRATGGRTCSRPTRETKRTKLMKGQDDSARPFFHTSGSTSAGAATRTVRKPILLQRSAPVSHGSGVASRTGQALVRDDKEERTVGLLASRQTSCLGAPVGPAARRWVGREAALAAARLHWKAQASAPVAFASVVRVGGRLRRVGPVCGSALGSLTEVAPGSGAQRAWIASLPWVWVPASAVSASGACARS